jgi:hypothetical protein
VTASGIHNYFWKARPIRYAADLHPTTDNQRSANS